VLAPHRLSIQVWRAEITEAKYHSRADLIAEDVILRQHLIVLKRQVKRPQLTNGDRIRWGAECIRGELLKLGVRVSKRTIQKYRPKVRRSSSQTWATFLKSHAGDILACDFTVAHDLLFRPLYIFVLMELQTRRIVHKAVTRCPSDDWTAQQLREAKPRGKGPNYDDL
jgi:hypothetical protein